MKKTPIKRTVGAIQNQAEKEEMPRLFGRGGTVTAAGSVVAIVAILCILFSDRRRTGQYPSNGRKPVAALSGYAIFLDDHQ
jgi:hypothetical protein